AWTVFWWDGDALHTPALELGILHGIGRARVLELVKRVVQGRNPAQELAGKSLFPTNAVRGIVPIASPDGATVPADPPAAEPAQLQPSVRSHALPRFRPMKGECPAGPRYAQARTRSPHVEHGSCARVGRFSSTWYRLWSGGRWAAITRPRQSLRPTCFPP